MPWNGLIVSLGSRLMNAAALLLAACIGMEWMSERVRAGEQKSHQKETRSIHKMFMEMVLSCSLANATLNNFWSGFLVSNSDTANRQRVDWLEREIFFFSFICDFQCVYCNQWALIRLSLCVYIPFWYGIHSPSQWIDMELRERSESVNEASVCHLNCHTNFSTFTQTIHEKISRAGVGQRKSTAGNNEIVRY